MAVKTKLFWSNTKYRRWCTRNESNWNNPIYNWLVRNFKEEIDKYRNETDDILELYDNSPHSKTLWSIWWQGEEEVPESIKLSINNLRHFTPMEANFIVITKDNYKDYIDLPKYIIDKVGKGISFTYLSDIVRWTILEEYGGLYLDAGFITNREIPMNYIWKQGVFTRKSMDSEVVRLIPCFGRFSSSSCGSSPHSVMSKFMKECYFKFWEQYDINVDYTMPATLETIAYDKLAAERADIDSLPYFNDLSGARLFYMLLEAPYNEDVYNKSFSEWPFQKLKWRNYNNIKKVTPDGKQTTYGHLCDTFVREWKGLNS